MQPTELAGTKRPTGATAIIVITGIEGLLLALVGIALLVSFGLFTVGGAGADLTGLGAMLGGISWFLALVVFVLALAYLAIAYGVWRRRRWSWMLGMVFSIIALVFAVPGLASGLTISAIVAVVLPALVVYFLWTPDVKLYLGRA